jgi:OmpA-OmpF porin, OOP family
VILYGIKFKTNSAEITPDSYTAPDHVADLLKSNAKMNMRIEGHTDNIGSEQYNLSLSSQRAASVKRYFVERHMVADNRLTTIGKGEANPIADNVMEAGRNANRRVEIHAAD